MRVAIRQLAESFIRGCTGRQFGLAPRNLHCSNFIIRYNVHMSDEHKKVLIVDDDNFLLEMYALKFKEAAFEVDVAQTGQLAIEKTRQMEPDVVLLDIVLPEKDGFEVLQEIKSPKNKTSPLVVMLTNLGQKDDTDRSIRLGADDYVVKAHFTPSEVVEKVKKLLTKKTEVT